jgi:hypothetical protein
LSTHRDPLKQVALLLSKRNQFSYAARLVDSARNAARCAARRVACRVTHRRLLHVAQARRRLLRLRRAFGCLGTSCSLSRGPSSTTLTTPRLRVSRHIARLITRLVAPLVVDYFAYTACPGASARPATHHAARRRLLHLCRASGCFGTSRSLSRDSLSTTSPRTGLSSTTSPTPRVRVPRHIARLVTRLVVNYFAYAVHPGASARRAAHHAASRRLLRAPQLPLAATMALLQPRRASRLLVSRQH